MTHPTPLHIRPATPADAPAVAAIILPVIQAGATYALDPAMTRPQALAYWLAPAHETFVADRAGRVVGTYYLRANGAGGASHVCNCGYMTAPDVTGTGVAAAMCAHSLRHASTRGFRAMQFNGVVATNTRAVDLWHRLGFETLARLPATFLHPTEGYVDTLLMFQSLVETP